MVRTIPLSKEIEPRPVIAVRAGCADDGSFLVPLYGGIEQTGLQLLRVTLDGKVVFRVDAEAAAGLGKLRVSDHALSPSGETYVLAHKIATQEFKRLDDGRTSRSETFAPSVWLLSFDSQGNLMEKRELSGPPTSPSEALVALPEGSLFITGTKGSAITFWGTKPPPVDAPRLPGDYAYFLSSGGDPRSVDLPKSDAGSTVARRFVDRTARNGGEIWLVRTAVPPFPSMLHVMRADGSIERSVRLDLPSELNVGMSKTWGDRLLVQLHSRDKTHIVRGSRFLELDAFTGKVLADYTFPTASVTAVCYSKSGPLFLDAAKRLLGWMRPPGD